MFDYPLYLTAARKNYVAQDPVLKTVLRRNLSATWDSWLASRLEDVGERAATVWADLAITANENPPKLLPLNRWGERIDQVEVHPAYDQIAKEAFEAGVVWPRFVPGPNGEKAPWTIPFAFGYVMSQAEQGFFCPVCLTAGSAWLLERFASPELRDRYLPRVAAQQYEGIWEGAMFLTERAGGSDVGVVETIAKQENGTWKLYGDKWFASNGGRAKAMMVLARPEGAPTGTKGLALFMVPWSLEDGTSNAIRIERLKDKLGTKSMPSTEIKFEGATAYVVGDVSKGFLHMVEMLKLSRIYNAVASVGNMRRTVNEAIAYTHARGAFGNKVDQYPLVQAKLIELAVEQEASFRLVFEAIAYLDRSEARQRNGEDKSREDAVLRVLTPMVKYHTGRESVDTASAVAELFGGNGYIEEWPIARFLRDAQVLPIWEGTTNILLLDVLRAFAKEQAGEALLADLDARIAKPFPALLTAAQAKLKAEHDDLTAHLTAIMALPQADITVHIKPWTDRAVRLFQAVLLLEAATDDLGTGNGRNILVLGSFLRRHYTEGGWQAGLAAPAPHTGFAGIIRQEAISVDDALVINGWSAASPAPAR